jgi:hypothetical protein
MVFIFFFFLLPIHLYYPPYMFFQHLHSFLYFSGSYLLSTLIFSFLRFLLFFLFLFLLSSLYHPLLYCTEGDLKSFPALFPFHNLLGPSLHLVPLHLICSPFVFHIFCQILLIASWEIAIWPLITIRPKNRHSRAINVPA